MKIVRTDAKLEMPGLDDRLRADGHDLVLLEDGVDEDRLRAALSDADLLLMCYTPVPRALIEAAPRLKGIVKYGVGIDAIDIPAARARGITVVNIPDYADRTVAEGALLLLLALRRRLPALMAEMDARGWTWPEDRWLGGDIAGMTLGLVGLGRIGAALARIAGQGFGADVVAFDPHLPDARFDSLSVRRADTLPSLLEQSDAVSLHVALDARTEGLMGAAEFARMKPGAVFVNVSRGGLVRERDLVDALDRGHLGGAGLDTHANEPLTRDHPLFGRPNVILLPHLTFWTREAMERLERDTYARVAELVEGRPVTIHSTDPRLAGQPGAVYPR